MIYHNTKTWFNDDFLDYFENHGTENRFGTFKVPQTTARQFDLNDIAVVSKLANSIANSGIAVAVQLKAKQFSEIEFTQFEADTQDELRKYVCEAVVNAITNRNIGERTNGSSLSGGNYNFTIDSPGGVLTSEMCGKFAGTRLQNSGIDEYEGLEGAHELYEELANGNLKLLKTLEVI